MSKTKLMYDPKYINGIPNRCTDKKEEILNLVAAAALLADDCLGCEEDGYSGDILIAKYLNHIVDEFEARFEVVEVE